MSLRADRVLFTSLFWRFLQIAEEKGYVLAQDMAKRCNGGPEHGGHDCPTGRPNSLHKRGLATDLLMYRDLDGDGEKDDYEKSTEAHYELGQVWEGMHARCRWGGRWNDGNHYELLPGDET